MTVRALLLNGEVNVLFLVKLTVTPLLMWFVSWASRRWGSTIGGLLAGMPLTSAPVSIYLMLEQGRSFAAEAALSSLGGITAVAASYLIYTFCSRRFSILCCSIAALAGFAGVMALLFKLHAGYQPVLALDLILISTGLAICRTAGEKAAAARTPRWDVPARIIAATAMVLAITFMARAIGPAFSGFLSPVPVIAWPFLVFVHHRQGRTEAVAAIRGILRGAFGLVLFYAATGLMLPYYNPVWTYFIALAGCVLTVTPWFLPLSSRMRLGTATSTPEASPVKNG